MVLIPLYTGDSPAVSPDSYGSSGLQTRLHPRASHLFGAASAGVTGGEHSLHASLHGPAAPLVGLNDIFDKSGIGVQPDEYERGCPE